MTELQGECGRARTWSTSKRCALAAASMLMMYAAPAQADFCVQLNGGSFSGDLGFFRFTGDLPTARGSITPLAGRVAGLGPVFGTAVVAKDHSYLEIGATFFVDADQGQIDVFFFGPRNKNGNGNASYGTYGLGDSVTATRVGCGQEP